LIAIFFLQSVYISIFQSQFYGKLECEKMQIARRRPEPRRRKVMHRWFCLPEISLRIRHAEVEKVVVENWIEFSKWQSKVTEKEWQEIN
jgi:hypothetical protein